MPNVRSALALGAALLWVSGCGHAAHSGAAQPSQAASSRPRPALSQRPVATARPATPTPAPAAGATSASPSSAALPSPVVTPPKLVAKVLRQPPDAAPRILGVAMSETTVHSGDTVSGSVLTTSNVASVQVRIGGYALTLAKTGVGRFALTYTVASLPWFIRGTFMMRVIARNTRGDSVEQSIPLTVR